MTLLLLEEHKHSYLNLFIQSCICIYFYLSLGTAAVVCGCAIRQDRASTSTVLISYKAVERYRYVAAV